MEIKRLGAWKSSTLVKDYVNESRGHKKKTSDQIAAAISLPSTSDNLLEVLLRNCSNVQITIN